MTIRHARADDVAAIAKLYAELHEPHRERYPDLFNDPIPERDLAALQKEIGDDDVLILIAEEAGAVVAFTRVLLVHTPEGRPLRSRRFGLVDDLVVSKTYRRQGLAAVLMAAAEAWAKQRRLESLEVTVWSFNDSARSLYERQGFEPFRHYLRKPL
jgi:ribosomal protein S18 acetylase RimI-like enzyme